MVTCVSDLSDSRHLLLGKEVVSEKTSDSSIPSRALEKAGVVYLDPGLTNTGSTHSLFLPFSLYILSQPYYDARAALYDFVYVSFSALLSATLFFINECSCWEIFNLSY